VAGTVFHGGNRDITTVSGATTLADVFPLTLAGAQAFQAALGRLQMSYADKEVPDEIEKFCFVDPYLHEVLQKDTTLMSRDYDGQAYNSLIKGKVMYCKGFNIVKSPTSYIPRTDLSASATAGDKRVAWIRGVAQYRADFTKVAAVVMAPGAIKAAVGSNLTGIAINSEETQSTIIGAKMFKGLATYRPELAGVIEWAG
jgi:hypothetical protein